MIITDKAQIKAVSLKESDKLHLTTSDELECYELLESDLKLPADATFTRSSVAYLSDGTQVDANMPRFEQGRFGKAVLVEEGTTNVVADPSFENADITANWNAAGSANWAYTGMARVRTRKKYGSASVKCGDGVTSGKGIAEKNQGTAAHAVSAGQIWTLSFDVYATNADTQYIALIRCYDSSGNNISDSVTPPSGWQYTSYYQALYFYQKVPGANAWYRITKQFTVPSGVAYVAISLQYYVGGDYYVWFDGVQFENKPYATSFIDGTRAAETLTIPTAGVLNPQEGTVECWVKPLFNNTTNYQVIFLCTLNGNRRAGTSRLTVWKDSANNVRFQLKDDNSAGIDVTVPNFLTNEVWAHLAVVYSTGLLKVFKNGSLVGQYTASMNPLNITSQHIICVGNSISNSSTDAFNGLIDDLRISNRARSDEEILAAYQSGKPLPVDEWTAYKLDFDDKVRITTQGQIICNELIEI